MPDLAVGPDEVTTLIASVYFSDPDGDRLSFRATSNDPSVVLAIATASELVLTPIGPGTATVTVTATDPGGLSASQTFEVTVTATNRQPVPLEPIPDQALPLAEGVSKLRLADYFSDPDGDSLDFRSSSNDPGVVAALVQNSELLLIPFRTGTATVTVTATDPGRLRALQTFEVTVTTNNRRPVSEEPIPDQFLALGGRESELPLADYFFDPDGDRLGFRASSNDPSVVSAVVAMSELVLIPLGPGTTTVSVTATDPGGLSASQRFRVTVGEHGAPATPTGIRIKEKGTDFIEWSWPEVSGAHGYEFQLGKNAQFAERDPVSTTFRASIRIDSLESDTLYSLRIRAFADFDGTRLKSPWSVPSGTWTDIERGIDPRFNRRFWEEIAFAKFDCPEDDPCEYSSGQLFPDLEERTLRVLRTTSPNFHLRTHNDQGERRISSAQAQTIRESIPDAVEMVTGHPFTGTVTEGPEDVDRSDWVTIEVVTVEDDPVLWVSDDPDRITCGTARVGASTGRIWLNGSRIDSTCRLAPLVRHEIGHALGLYHVGGNNDLMSSQQNHVEHFTSREQFHAQLAYELGRDHPYTSNPERMTFAPQREAPRSTRRGEEMVTVICRGR